MLRVRYLGEIEATGRTGSRSSAGCSSSVSASAPDSGRRHSLSSRGRATPPIPARAHGRDHRAQSDPSRLSSQQCGKIGGRRLRARLGNATTANPFASDRRAVICREWTVSAGDAGGQARRAEKCRRQRITARRRAPANPSASEHRANGRPRAACLSLRVRPCCAPAAEEARSTRHCVRSMYLLVGLIVVGEQTAIAAFDAIRFRPCPSARSDHLPQPPSSIFSKCIRSSAARATRASRCGSLISLLRTPAPPSVASNRESLVRFSRDGVGSLRTSPSSS